MPHHLAWSRLLLHLSLSEIRAPVGPVMARRSACSEWDPRICIYLPAKVTARCASKSKLQTRPYSHIYSSQHLIVAPGVLTDESGCMSEDEYEGTTPYLGGAIHMWLLRCHCFKRTCR
ncbi:hypothetical protein BD413DRAFT_130603 [Trametes elegans]|nr:hypothetical protein BD413DRAFT_130603 [Trametes elegans]